MQPASTGALPRRPSVAIRIALGVLALAACGGGGDSSDHGRRFARIDDPLCDRMFELVDQCGFWRGLPTAAADKAREMCAVMRRDLARPGVDRRNDVWATAVDDCAHATTCDALKTCMTHNNCVFVLKSPTDREPEFMCSPPAP